MNDAAPKLQSPTIIVPSQDPLEVALCHQIISDYLKIHGKDFHNTLSHPNTLPLVWCQRPLSRDTHQLSLFSLGPFRQRFFKYFYEFCVNICLGKIDSDPIAYHVIDLSILEYPNYPRLTLCKIQMQLKHDWEVDLLETTIMQSQKHLRSGLWTGNFSDWSVWRQRAAEDEKLTRICERWSELSSSMPVELAKITSNKLHQLIVSLSKKLLHERSSRHIIDIAKSMALPIWSQSTKEKSARRRCWLEHHRRRIFSNDRPLLMDCYTITLSYLRSHETLEDRHLLQALKEFQLSHSPSHFFISIKDPETRFHHFYLEVPYEAINKNVINRAMIKNLEELILGYIERKQMRIFQPRNDEDSFKRLIALAKEVQSVDDHAQISLSFEEQTDDRLVFSFSMARPLPAPEVNLEGLVSATSPEVLLRIEKTRKVEEGGFSKELILAQVEVTKIPFIREDHSVDLHRARFHILQYLSAGLGTLRDYNGGLMAKQHQLLEEVFSKLGHIASEKRLLLEEIFFALQPSVITASLNVDHLCALFEHVTRSYPRCRQVTTTPCIFWQEKGSLVLVVAFSTDADGLQPMQKPFQELMKMGDSVAQANLAKANRQIYAALASLESETSTAFKKRVRQQLAGKKIVFHTDG